MIKAFTVKVYLFHFSARLGLVCIRNGEPRAVNSVSLHGIWEKNNRQTGERNGSYSSRCMLNYWLTGRYILWSELKN